MYREIANCLRLAALTITICVLAYTGFTFSIAAIVSPDKSSGSLVTDSAGKIRGSRLIAQAFTRPEYLWPRPSAVDYNASAADGSNFSPTNVKIRERAIAILETYTLPSGSELPADLVTSSGSGLDPHISLEAALIQADRVAEARNLSVAEVHELMHRVADARLQGWGTQQGLVNVLEFNLLLDSKFPIQVSP